jgi:hypothetical protein
MINAHVQNSHQPREKTLYRIAEILHTFIKQLLVTKEIKQLHIKYI